MSKRIFLTAFILMMSTVLFCVVGSAEDSSVETVEDRTIPIAFKYDGSEVNFKYFGASGSKGYTNFVTNEIYGKPFFNNLTNNEYFNVKTVDSFSQLLSNTESGDILRLNDTDSAVVVYVRTDKVKITRSYDWQNNNGRTETTVLTDQNYSSVIASPCEIWRKTDLDELYGTSETPAFGDPYTTVVANDNAYIKCTIFRNDCIWNFVGAYYGTDPDNMTLVGSDKVKLTGNTWSGFTLKYLQPNTTYYYKFFTSTSEKTYWSDVASFTTPDNIYEPAFGDPYTTKEEKDNAYIKCSLFKNNFAATKVGAYIGTSLDDMHEWGYDKVGNTCTWGGYTLRDLEPNTTYYYRFYLKNDSDVYWSETASFKTFHDHDYASVVTKQPTCTSTGIETLTCNICEDEQTKTIPTTPHDYKDMVIEPTYLEKGYTKHICSVCSDTYCDEYTDKRQLGIVTDFKPAKMFDNAITLSWERVDDAQGYIIYRYDFEEDTWKEITRTISDISDYTVSDLPASTFQRFAIKAYKYVSDKEISSPDYPILNTTTRPETVKLFNVRSYTDSTITLEWEKAENIEGYLIYRYDPDKDIYVNITRIDDNNVCTYTDKELNGATYYEYIIYTLKKLDETQYAASETCLMTSVTTKPSDVTGFKVTATSAQAVKLAWNKVHGATGYVVYRAVNGKWVRVGVVKSNAFYEDKLKAGTSYRYAVKAYQTLNDTNVYSVSYPTLWTSTIPANVSTLKVKATSADAVKLTWNKVSGATGYVVYRAVNGKWIRVGDVKSNSFYDGKLKSGTSYKYAVKAYRTVDGKNYYSAKYPTLTTSTKPEAVSFKVTSGSDKATVKWSKVTGAAGYKVYYKTSKNGKWKLLKTVNNKTTSYTKTKLVKGKTYWFTVKAFRNVNGRTYNSSYKAKGVKIK